MADRISSDHPSVDTVRATHASTPSGSEIQLPATAAESFPADEVVRVVLDGDEVFAQVQRALAGDHRVIRGVYAAPGQARDPSGGTDRLESWLDGANVPAGGSVLVDVVEQDFCYGFRAPGETAFYDAIEPPASSLQDIAKGLDESTEDSA